MDATRFILGCVMVAAGAVSAAVVISAVFFVAHRVTNIMDNWQDRRR